MQQWIRTSLVVFLSTALLTACGGTNGSGNESASPQEGTVERRTSFDAAPAMEIDPAKTYEATMTTSKGDITIELFAKEAPITVNNFVFLSKNRYYEGITFHRIVPDFVIQAGDPQGTGAGGPGYTFEDELDSPYEYEPGIVAMANRGPDTNGSQFFICSGDYCRNLNETPNYTIFGRVTSGMDVVEAIDSTPIRGQGTPTETVTIESVEVREQ
ncbi:peptidylprolyl isomerase [Paenibacillus sp. TRM 82003]|nr:peptidylprolyl isomerase [Paenibacillus sp. TRM 82003]